MRESRGRGSKQRYIRLKKELQMKSSSQPATVPMGPSKRDTDHHWGLDRTVSTSQHHWSYQGEKRAHKVKQRPAEKGMYYDT